jgi:hypothetical protein
LPVEKKVQVSQYYSVGINQFKTFINSRRAQSGNLNTGMLYIIIIMLIIFGIAYIATGPTPTQSGVQHGTEVAINDAKSEQAKDRLQLYTFTGVTITPPASSLCKPGGVNARPEIIAYVYPPNGEGISVEDQIKIWVNDNKPPLIAPAEKITRNSGAIITPGDRTAKAPDGHLYEPALYVFPQSVEAGGQPYFPTNIRGDYNNGTIRLAFGIERLPAHIQLKNRFTSQYTWNVKDLGLQPGAYQLQFVVMDGADKHAITCVSMRVYQNPDRRWVIPD